MKIVKRLLLIFLVLIVLLIGAAIAIPYFYKAEILALVEEEANKNLKADVTLGDASLSLFRSFPNLNLQVESFAITGREPFAGIALAKGESAAFSLDLMSVIKSDRPVAIRSVRLDAPELNIIVLEDGTANYDITLPTDERIQETNEETDYSGVVIELDEYAINNAHIIYDDRAGDTYFEAQNLNHSGEGNFTMEVYDLDTDTQIDAMTVSQGGITYLKAAEASLDAIFNIDQANAKYTLKDNQLTINALQLSADGYVAMPGEDIEMDLQFSTPQNDFKSLLSMIPNAYIEGYEDVKADGQFSLSGNVKGVYNADTESLPAFKLDLTVDGASVQYPDLPMGISGIEMEGHVNSPSSDLDELTVDVPRFRMRLGNNPFNANFALRRPISDPDVKARAEGVINLADISKAFPVEGVDELTGLIDADVTVDTRLSYIEQEAYERVNMDGDLAIKNMVYKGEGLPRVQINSARASFTPQKIDIPAFDTQLGKSDMRGSGSIQNILAYFSPEKTMRGQFQLRSNSFDADEWMEEEAPAGESKNSSAGSYGSTSTEPVEVFDQFDFDVDAAINQIKYDVYDIRDAVAVGNIKPNRLEAQRVGARIGESDFGGSGTITGIFDYLFDEGMLGGSLRLQSQRINLNQFMEAYEGDEAAASSSTSTEEAYSTIPVPDNIDMEVSATVGELIYTNIELKDVVGHMLIADETITLDEATAKGLGGQMDIAGRYATKGEGKPTFDFKYDLRQLDFQQAFNTLNTFEQLAPIGKYIKGKFTTTMIMDGELGPDMMPILTSITASGFLQTLDAVIQNFAPTQAIGEKLNVSALKGNIDITNTKNWFEIKNGALEVKEYDTKIKDIGLKIGGIYSLASLLDFNIKARIPRERIESNALGAAASQGFGLLQGQASKLGINIQQGEFVNVLINLTGAVDKPKIGIKLLGMDGDGGETSLTESVKEEAKAQIQDKINEGKDAARAAAQRTADSLRRVAEERVRKAREEAERKAKEAAKKKLEEVVDSSTIKKAEDVLDNVGKDAEDKIKDELDKWNPFNKKKKGGG